ncbi:MAG: hypothetical protein R3C52_01490 [Hyphomonadaceae bacterium]
MTRTLAFIGALATVLVTLPAHGQEEAAEQPSDPRTTIVVQADREEEAIRNFIGEVAAAPSGVNLARWGDEICVGAFNMAPDYAQALIDRVSLVGAAIGVQPGEPGCRPNVLIMATEDGGALARRLVADHPRTFQPAGTDNTNLGRKALKRFQADGAPVRWWLVSQTVGADTGMPVRRGDSVRVRTASRLRQTVREDISHVLVILDVNQIGSIGFGSLSDYVAMVVMAQVDAKADTREYSTILNLFAKRSGDRTDRLTQWDLDYLTALYAMDGDAATARLERGQLARSMLEQRKYVGQ